jgi:IS30 family transposase
MGVGGKVTDEMRAAVLADVALGVSYRQIAPRYGITDTTVRRIVKALDVAEATRQRKRRVGSIGPGEREQIAIGIDRGESCPTIAARIGFDRRTVWREISRNGGRDNYRAHEADQRALDKALRPRVWWFEAKPWLWAEVKRMLRLRWSPEQISAALAIAHDGDPDWSVSHESIYRALYVQTKGQLRSELTDYLRTGRPNRRRRDRWTRGEMSPIVGMVNIADRPVEIEDRAVPGHWEGDLIVGKGAGSFVATLVERTTRMGMLISLQNKTTDHVTGRLAEHVQTLPAQLVRSLTWDRGTEMAGHRQFSVETDVPVYFCDPHSPWQRGSNENWNGLVRQFLPKGIDLTKFSQHDLDEIAHLLNTRPRKTLGWETPADRFNKLVALTD